MKEEKEASKERENSIGTRAVGQQKALAFRASYAGQSDTASHLPRVLVHGRHPSVKAWGFGAKAPETAPQNPNLAAKLGVFN